MSRRGMVSSLPALIIVPFGGLRWWTGHLREEEERARAERLKWHGGIPPGEAT